MIFVGHGGRTPDLDGDEDDGKIYYMPNAEYGDMADCLGFDDVIYPVDYKAAGHIVDDEMHDIMYV